MSTSLQTFLETNQVPQNLLDLVLCLASTTHKVSEIFRSTPVDHAGSSNVYGDEQLSVDLLADDEIFSNLKNSRLVSFAASEEQPNGKSFDHPPGHEPPPFSVYFDPLDGSSIADCNWSIGTIFSAYLGSASLCGRRGSDQVLAAVAVHGPRTTIVFGLNHPKLVFETTLINNAWFVTRLSFKIETRAKIFSPANLRSANDLPGYKRILDHWISQRLTLRYTGGMVPDVVGILMKGNGIFASPVSDNARAKLRLVFEVAPIAMIIELAGGKAVAPIPGTRPTRILDIDIETVNDRIGIICGSESDVYECLSSIYQQP